MDIKKILNNIKNIEKEKIILIGLAGILLLGASCMGSGENEKKEETTTLYSLEEKNYQDKLEDRVKTIIENIKGVSNVSVMITYKSGYEKILKEDVEGSISGNRNNEEEESNQESKKTTVILEQDGNSVPYVVKEIYPEIEGIAVVANGVTNDEMKEKIIDMLSALFDVSLHKISVLENE